MSGWSRCKGDHRNGVDVLFTEGHRLQRSEAGKKGIAHYWGAATPLLVTTFNWMTYMQLVFYQHRESRRFKTKQTHTHTHTHTLSGKLEMTGDICSSFPTPREVGEKPAAVCPNSVPLQNDLRDKCKILFPNNLH